MFQLHPQTFNAKILFDGSIMKNRDNNYLQGF